MPEVYELHPCSFCNNLFTYVALLHHLKIRHGDVGKEEAERLRGSHSYTFASPNHRVSSEPDSSREPESEMKGQMRIECPECGLLFKKDRLAEHVVSAHSYTANEQKVLLKRMGFEQTPEDPDFLFKCEHCDSSFWTKRALITHLDETHSKNEEPSTSTSFIRSTCPVEGCCYIPGSCEEFVEHCASFHSEGTNQDFKIFRLSFRNIDEFLEWKTEAEEQTCTYFRLRCKSNNLHTAEYGCDRSTSSIPSDCSSSEKIAAKICTAFVKYRVENDGSVEAIGCMDHIGHARGTEKFRFNSKQKDELRGHSSKELPAPSDIIKTMKKKCNKQSKPHSSTSTDSTLHDNNVASTTPDTPMSLECEEGALSTVKMDTLEKPNDTSIQTDESEKRKADIYYKCEFCQFSCFTRAVLDSHLQTYHPRARSEGESLLPPSSPVTCPKCQRTFRTRYLLSVHCVGVHTTAMTDFSLIQISFNSWAQFEPWRTMMERDTKAVLVKSEMLSSNTKLIHLYQCQFDRALVQHSVEGENVKEKEKHSSNCPAFIKVVENEDGILDCVACFGHLGHEMAGLPPESNVESVEMKQDESENHKKNDIVPCFLCGGVLPPEIDAKTCEEVKWCCCSDTECQVLAHEWCTQLLGKKCFGCQRGVLILG